MNGDQREQVRSNAKYLREVRPIDADEIHEYVEGTPHPAAVRQVLRESAFELGLIERADGLFVPVAESPVTGPFHGVDTFPEEYGFALEELLVERYGPGWPEGEAGEALRETIRAVKEDYLYQRDVEYDAETALAYALDHLPDYYATTQYVLAELAADGLVGRQLRVLDVGAGVGGPALGLHDLLPEDALVDYHAVEPSDAAGVLESLLEETDRNFHATVHRETAEEFDPEALLSEENGSGDAADSSDGDSHAAAPEEGFDLILFSNVLSELAEPAAVVERYGEALSPDGTVVATAPADRNTAVGLREVERAVADDGPFTVYAPTVRLWQGATPDDDCWSFDVRPDIEVPGFQRRLDEAGAGDGEFVNVDVQYAYSLFRIDGRRRVDVSLDEGRVAKLGNSDTHVTNRVDCYAAKLSHDLSEGGNPLFRIGDGSQGVDHFAVLTDESALNADLLTAGYGDLLAFQNALVLWNDDEEAYNLVVDGETVVDRVPV